MGSDGAAGAASRGVIRQSAGPTVESCWTRVDGRWMRSRYAGPAEIAGRAEVVLVHGFVVASRSMLPTLEKLTPYFRVHAIDLPGFGESEGPRGALDIGGLALALEGWMAASSIESAVLVGNSVGCQIIVDLAARGSGRIGGVVLQAPTMDPQARNVVRLVGRLLRDGSDYSTSQLGVMARDYLAAGPRRIIRTLRYCLRDRIEEKLPRVRVPALVVRGSQDSVVPRRWAKEVARRLPHGRLVEVPGASHAMNYTAPSQLARVVRDFVGAA